jgi:hypothetical protein
MDMVAMLLLGTGRKYTQRGDESPVLDLHGGITLWLVSGAMLVVLVGRVSPHK